MEWVYDYLNGTVPEDEMGDFTKRNAVSGFLHYVMDIEEIVGKPISISLDGQEPFFSPWRDGFRRVKFTFTKDASPMIRDLLKKHEGRVFENIKELKRSLGDHDECRVVINLVDKTLYTCRGGSISVCTTFGILEFVS